MLTPSGVADPRHITRSRMPDSVADALWSMIAGAGVKRCYGIVGDALNPVVDALRRNGRVEFIQMRNGRRACSRRSPKRT
jgi:glyoxylate carboligase